MFGRGTGATADGFEVGDGDEGRDAVGIQREDWTNSKKGDKR